MRPLLLLAVLAFPPALHADAPVPPVQADWRRDAGVDDRVKAALTGKGWRFEADGRALDPKTKAPVSKPVLEKTVLDLRQDARRAALEAVTMLTDPKREPELGDKERLEKLAQDLPPKLAAALLNPKSDAVAVRAMAGAELDAVAAYFDGNKTLAERRDAAQPVAAGAPGTRAGLPYFTTTEQSVGDKLRASAQTEIGRDPYGRTVLARLNVAGKPSLPPIVIEELGGQVVAQYDYRRGAIALDREIVLGSVLSTVPPARRSALRTALADRDALMTYLDRHPEAVSAVVKDGDVVLVHELTHAWQDRRDPIFHEIARGNIPDVQPLEYEEEAYTTKNLYIHSKLKNDPASVKRDEELKDYAMMIHGVDSWRQNLFLLLGDASPARAIPARSIHAFESARLERARKRPVTTREQQEAKSLDLKALTHGERELVELQNAHPARMKALDAELRKAKPESYKLLGRYYLGQALAAERATDRSALLTQAERYAKADGDKILLEEIKRAMQNH